MLTFLVVLSEKCNLDCSYCDVDKRSKKHIDVDLYLSEFRKLREKNPTEKIKVDFFGGEPLLHLDLVKKIIAELENDGNVKFFMPTNALLLTQEIVDYLNEKNVEVSVSFDGLWQDRNRLQLNGKPTSLKYLDKRDIILKLNKPRIHTMIYKGCYNLLENHLFISNMFGINPELTLVRDVDVWNIKSVEKLLNGINELFNWYVENPQSDMPNFIRFYLRHFLQFQKKGLEKDNCGAGTDIQMFSENKVYPCTRFKNKPELIEKIPDFLKMRECATCEVRYYCEKGCLFEQIKNNGPIVELCTIYKHVYAKVRDVSYRLKDNQHFRNTLAEEYTNV